MIRDPAISFNPVQGTEELGGGRGWGQVPTLTEKWVKATGLDDWLDRVEGKGNVKEWHSGLKAKGYGIKSSVGKYEAWNA